MRKPSEYIAAAAAKVRDSLMSDCSLALAHGDRTATVTRVTTLSRGADSVSESSVSESIRVMSLAADLPDITTGDPVELTDNTESTIVEQTHSGLLNALRVVTSVRLDPARVMQYIGLSSPFDEVVADYQGTRRDSSGDTFSINHNAAILIHDEGNADEYGDAFAPAYLRSFTVAIRASDWTYSTDPIPSDTIDTIFDGAALALKVSTVTRRAGWLILKCRTRG